MPITYIKLFAGLGNQLFQYSYGKYLEQQGKCVKFILNRTKDAAGNCYYLPEYFAVDESQILMPRSKIMLNIHKVIAKFIAHDWNTGFYQECRFPQNLSDRLFVFKKKVLYEKIDIFNSLKSCEAVALHIRGGDYLSKTTQAQYGNICTYEYYKAAINFFLKTISSPVFFVFTNDSIYAQEMIQKLNIDAQFIPPSDLSTDPAFDMFLMSQCKHNIIANSTFSWWGAWLNKNPLKKIIAPEKWSNTEESQTAQLIPDTWIRIAGSK